MFRSQWQRGVGCMTKGKEKENKWGDEAFWVMLHHAWCLHIPVMSCLNGVYMEGTFCMADRWLYVSLESWESWCVTECDWNQTMNKFKRRGIRKSPRLAECCTLFGCILHNYINLILISSSVELKFSRCTILLAFERTNMFLLYLFFIWCHNAFTSFHHFLSAFSYMQPFDQDKKLLTSSSSSRRNSVHDLFTTRRIIWWLFSVVMWNWMLNTDCLFLYF